MDSGPETPDRPRPEWGKLAALILAITALIVAGQLQAFCSGAPTRTIVWQTDNPEVYGHESVEGVQGLEFRYDGKDGWLYRPEGDWPEGSVKLSLMAYDNYVTHRELVEFANAMFAEQGWPPPDLSDPLDESTFCTSDF